MRHSTSDYDSTGETLSPEQQAYFADSKIRDEQGRLMVMYHGTPSGNYEHFRSGTYFTPNREYADVYQNPGASSISYGKKQDAPTTFAMYLNMEKPFDTRNPKERSIFMKEYYRKYGTGAPLSESGLPDWTDGMDLQEFIEEMEYDYDGLILDEGGVPDGDGDVKSRGLSYVIFDPAQAKAVDNKTPTGDKRFRFSMSDYDDTVREGENVLEELLTMTAAHRMTDAEAARVARKVLKAASSEMELEEATQRIKSIFDYASRSGDKLDMYGLSSEATALAEDMLSQSKTLDMQHEEEVADLRYYLKHNQISLSPEQQKEAGHLMGGSYGAYRQALFGRVNLRNSGSGLDGAVWEQLHEAAPHLFPLDATSGDQVRLLMEAAEYVQPVYRNESGLDAREAAQWLTHELFKGYMSLSGRRLGLGAGKGKFYLTEYKGSAQLAADSAQQTGRGNSPKVMELYVSAQKVMDRSEYDQRLTMRSSKECMKRFRRWHTKKERGRSNDPDCQQYQQAKPYILHTLHYHYAWLPECVNETHQSLLSDDVPDRFGEKHNSAGYYSDRIKPSTSDCDQAANGGCPVTDP